MNLNKALIIGRMARDPELKVMPSSGTNVANFSVATNESYTKNGEKIEKTEFHNIVVYGSTAENCAKYLKKGQLVMVEGKITTRTWDKEDGSKGYKTEVIAFNVQFGPKGKNEPGDTSPRQDGVDLDTGDIRPARGTAGGKNAHTAVIPPGGKRVSEDQIEYPTEEINPDDIPF